jgi:hypothetical protein
MRSFEIHVATKYNVNQPTQLITMRSALSFIVWLDRGIFAGMFACTLTLKCLLISL